MSGGDDHPVTVAPDRHATRLSPSPHRGRQRATVDVVLAMHLRGDAFTAAQKARNVAYYEAHTVRDSSLWACPQAVLTAEVGALDLAYDYLAECALTGLHTGTTTCRAGCTSPRWPCVDRVVAGLGGMRDHGGHLAFAP